MLQNIDIRKEEIDQRLFMRYIATFDIRKYEWRE